MLKPINHQRPLGMFALHTFSKCVPHRTVLLIVSMISSRIQNEVQNTETGQSLRQGRDIVARIDVHVQEDVVNAGTELKQGHCVSKATFQAKFADELPQCIAFIVGQRSLEGVGLRRGPED